MPNLAKEVLPAFIAQAEAVFGLVDEGRRITSETEQIRYQGAEVSTIDCNNPRSLKATFSSPETQEQWLKDRSLAHALRLLLGRVFPLSLQASLARGSNFYQLEQEGRFLESRPEGLKWKAETEERIRTMRAEKPFLDFADFTTHFGTLVGKAE